MPQKLWRNGAAALISALADRRGFEELKSAGFDTILPFVIDHKV
jgi:hypothetical protein